MIWPKPRIAKKISNKAAISLLVIVFLLTACSETRILSPAPCLPLESHLAPKIREIRKKLEPYYEIKPPETSFVHNDYTYSYENFIGTTFKALYRSGRGKKELVIDPDFLAASFGNPNPGILRISKDDELIAFSPESNEVIIICKMPSNNSCEIVESPFYDFQWADDSNRLYFTVLTKGRSNLLKSIDFTGKEEKLIYNAHDEREFINLTRKNGKLLLQKHFPEKSTYYSLPDMRQVETNSFPDISHPEGSRVDFPFTSPHDPKSAMTARIAESLDYDAGNYTALTLYAEAEDKKQIPISIYFKSSLQKKTPPLLLSSYGAYGKLLDTSFKPYLLYLLDQGYVLAYAHIRGGGEKGPKWHEDGRGNLKKNSYSDLKTSTAFLKTIYPESEIFLHTRSAGALAAVNAAHNEDNIFTAMILDYPFLDAQRYIRDSEDNLAEREKEEWGAAPSLNAARVPLTLINSSPKDSIIPSGHIEAWVREMSLIPSNKIFIHLSESGNHSGEEQTYREIEERALFIAFISEHRSIRKQCCPYGHR